ncbi:M20/M25/M40 family metallo-hydrolase [Caloranaerobacter azorensis]|uniref:M20/M25/M40 family metallo-hydrolase n=1 Tax=Caloranaerobacter azorensis TaxID=116090 RepID=UPI0009DE615E
MEGKFIDIVVRKEVFEELVDFSNKGYSVNIDINLVFKEVEVSNVIGYIPGNDEKLKKEVILISAHFDHVGTDPDGSVFNGALDNASGTGMLLELARAMKESGKKPKRTIVFAAFNGEESGLQGSKYYVFSRPFPLMGTKVFNIDMIGSREKVRLGIYTFPSQQRGTVGQLVSSELVDKIVEIAEKRNIECKVNSFSKDSDHLSFDIRGVPAVTITHPADNLIHTVEDDISNIDKERLKEAGMLMISLIDYFAISAKDTIKPVISEEQLQILKIIPIYISAILLIGLAFIFVIKSINKNEKLKEKFGRRPIFTSILIVIMLLSILIYNSSYEAEETSTVKPLSKPWENQVKITGESIEKILDFQIDDNVNILLKDKKGIKFIMLDKYGKVKEGRYLNIPYEGNGKYVLNKNGIYYTYERNLFCLTNESERAEKILKNIDDFSILENSGKKYIIASNKDKIIVKSEQWEKNIEDKNILNVSAQMDCKDRIFILYKQKDKGNILVKYAVFNADGKLINSVNLYTLKQDSHLVFGIDKAKGYVFFKEQEDYYYLTFYLSSRRNHIVKKERIELHDTGGAAVKINEIPSIVTDRGIDNIDLYMTINAENYTGKKYIYFLNFFNGRLVKNDLIYETKNNKITSPVIGTDGEDVYIVWLEGKNENVLKVLSSNEYFGFNSLKNELLLRLSKIIQNLFLAFIVLLTKIHWIIPGVLILILFKILKKDEWLANGKAMYIAALSNFICQIATFKMPNLMGISYENVIVTFFIGIIALGLVLFYRYEKGKASFLRLFIIFTVINMIFISSLYAPYTLKGGLERLNKTEMFNKEKY